MVSIFSLFKVRPSWVFILPPLLIYVGIFVGFGFSYLFLTFTILILSSFYFTFSFNFKERISDSAAYSEETKSKSRRSSPASSSEFQYVDHFSIREDSDNLERPSLDPVKQGLCCLDGSISDEESLIEIALQTGYYVNHEKEEDKKSRFQKKPDFSPEANLKNGRMEILANRINDANEEDNWIEIDISVGSIKYTRYEIVD